MGRNDRRRFDTRRRVDSRRRSESDWPRSRVQDEEGDQDPVEEANEDHANLDADHHHEPRDLDHGDNATLDGAGGSGDLIEDANADHDILDSWAGRQDPSMRRRNDRRRVDTRRRVDSRRRSESDWPRSRVQDEEGDQDPVEEANEDHANLDAWA